MPESLEHRVGGGQRNQAGLRRHPRVAQLEPCMQTGSKMKNVPSLHNEIYFRSTESLIKIYSLKSCSPFE